jgi:hypothetical protein
MSGKQPIKVNPERQRKRFTPEFKREAVRLLEQGGKPAAQLGKIGRLKIVKIGWIVEIGVMRLGPGLESGHVEIA